MLSVLLPASAGAVIGTGSCPTGSCAVTGEVAGDDTGLVLGVVAGASIGAETGVGVDTGLAFIGGDTGAIGTSTGGETGAATGGAIGVPGGGGVLHTLVPGEPFGHWQVVVSQYCTESHCSGTVTAVNTRPSPQYKRP